MRILLNKVVVGAHSVPRDSRVRVSFNKFVSNVVQFALFIKLNHDTAKQRNCFDIIWVLVLYFLKSFIALVKIVLVEKLLGLDEPDIEGVLLV